MLRMFRRRTVCSSSEGSANWSWPMTRAHERYHDLAVTTVTCLKHPWSVRLYDPQKMRFMRFAEERAIVRQIQASACQGRQAVAHAANSGL